MISAGESPKVGSCNTQQCITIKAELYAECVNVAARYRTDPDKARERYDAFVKEIDPITTRNGTVVRLMAGESPEAQFSQWVFSNACYDFFMKMEQIPDRRNPVYVPFYEDGGLSIADVATLNRQAQGGKLDPGDHLHRSEDVRNAAGGTEHGQFVPSEVADDAESSVAASTAHCETLDDMARFLCEREAREGESEAVDQAWKCVTDNFIAAGGTKAELEKLANVGFTKDPTRHPVFSNDPALEPQEKLDFAYANPKYYHCIAQAGLPLPFAMNDFSSATTHDDEKREEVDRQILKISEGTWGSTPKPPIARKIFDLDLEAYPFYADCPVECADYDALKYRQGRCTETSAFFYYQAEKSDADPHLFWLRDLEPSLDWISYLEYMGMAADHVFVGIPRIDKARSLDPEDYVHVDLTNKRFDADYSFAKPISERDFAALWQFNRAQDLMGLKRFDEAEAAIIKSLEASPDNVIVYLFLSEYYKNHGKREEPAFLSGYIGRHFDGHPWSKYLRFMMEFAAAGIDDPDGAAAKAKFEEFEKIREEMIRENPDAFAQINYIITASSLGKFVKSWMAAKNSGRVTEELKRQLLSAKVILISSYATSLLVNPNYFFAFRDLEAILDLTKSHEDAISIYSRLLEKNPGHAPFIYALAKHCHDGASTKGADREKLFYKALEEAQKLIRLDPKSPLPYILIAASHANLGEFAKAQGALLKARVLYKAMGERMPMDNYSILVDSCVFLGRRDEALDFVHEAIEAHGESAAKIIAENFSQRGSWSYGLKHGKSIADVTVPLDVDEKIGQMCACIIDVTDLLDDFKAARPSVLLIRARSLPFVALFGDIESGRRLFKTISREPSKEVLKSLSATTQQLAETLLAFNAATEKKFYDRVEIYLGWIEDLMLDGDPTSFYNAKLGLAWGYVLSGDEKAAWKAIDDIPAKECIPRLEFCIQRLLSDGHESVYATRCLHTILDFSWRLKDHMTAAQRAKFSWYYDELARICILNQMSAEAVSAGKRAESMRK